MCRNLSFLLKLPSVCKTFVVFIIAVIHRDCKVLVVLFRGSKYQFYVIILINTCVALCRIVLYVLC
jgi:hypothetical protein